MVVNITAISVQSKPHPTHSLLLYQVYKPSLNAGRFLFVKATVFFTDALFSRKNLMEKVLKNQEGVNGKINGSLLRHPVIL